MNFVRATDLFPAFICITYYLVVLFVAEVSRKLVDMMISKHSLIYLFLMELIATTQMCTCVYENGIIIKHYGVLGFFTVVASLLIIGGIINRGAYVSPFMPIERFIRGTISTERFLTVLLAQVLGGISAFRCANALWYYSLSYSADHHQHFERLPCAISYKVPFVYAFVFEIFGSFLLRIIIFRIPEKYKKYVVPFVFASFLSFALAYIGVPGLNPVVAASRLQGCPGLDLQWFIMTYWFAPVAGWLLAAQFDHKKALRSATAKAKSSGGKKKN